MNSTKSGYILVMALLIIALVVLITGVMTDVGGSYVPYMSAMAQRQKARLLAMGGIACAQSQLARVIELDQTKKPEQGQKAQKITPEQEATILLKDILPVINTWQTIELKVEKEGIDGTLQIFIACEDGKLNINELFDFKAKKFKDEKKGEQSVKTQLNKLLGPVEKRMKSPELVATLENILAKRGYPLNDITELLTNTGCAGFKHAQFVTPESHTSLDKEKTAPFMLTDLFTTYTNHMDLEPWLLSDAVRRLYTQQEQATSKGKSVHDKEALGELLKKFKVQAEWSRDWDEWLKPIYGVAFNQLPKGAVQFFAKTFDPRIFSVTVVATVGESTQRLYAILERIRKSQDTKTLYDMYIRAFYWI